MGIPVTMPLLDVGYLANTITQSSTRKSSNERAMGCFSSIMRFLYSTRKEIRTSTELSCISMSETLSSR